MSKTMTPAELASELGSDARTTRKFLRSITPRDEQPGKGSRWAVEANARQLASLRKKFAAFEKAQAEARAAREAAKAIETAPLELDDDATDDDALEPTDAELAAIDAE